MNKENFDNLYKYLTTGDRVVAKELAKDMGYITDLHFIDGNKLKIYFCTPESPRHGSQLLTVKVEERVGDDMVNFPKVKKYINSTKFLRDLSCMLASNDISISLKETPEEVFLRLEEISKYHMVLLDDPDAKQRRIYIPDVALITFKWKGADSLLDETQAAIREYRRGDEDTDEDADEDESCEDE